MRAPAPARDDVAQAACMALERLRAKGPRVHCITNAVAQNFTANVLLSLGCVPSMTLSAEEVGNFVSGAQALLVKAVYPGVLVSTVLRALEEQP